MTNSRQIGVGYARADANGHFEMEVPRRGRYLMLVISHGERHARSTKPSPIFAGSAHLLIVHPSSSEITSSSSSKNRFAQTGRIDIIFEN
jgi:hypothetical protein